MSDRAPTPAEVAAHFGATWLAHVDLVEAQLAPVDDVLLARAELRPGESVVDIGCGRGPTARSAAEQVAPGGRVVGVDLAAPLVEAATRLPAPANVSWVAADAATEPLAGAPFDVALSRFGTIFFADPIPAMTHVRAHLRPAGRLVMAVWRHRDASEIMERPLEVAASVLADRDLAAEVPPPHAGPFAWGDDAFVADVLAGAGWTDVDVHDEVVDPHPGGPGCDPATATTMWQALGPLTAFREMDADVRDAIAAAVAADLAAGDGTTRSMGAALAIVTARNPG